MFFFFLPAFCVVILLLFLIFNDAALPFCLMTAPHVQINSSLPDSVRPASAKRTASNPRYCHRVDKGERGLDLMAAMATNGGNGNRWRQWQPMAAMVTDGGDGNRWRRW